MLDEYFKNLDIMLIYQHGYHNMIFRVISCLLDLKVMGLSHIIFKFKSDFTNLNLDMISISYLDLDIG